MIYENEDLLKVEANTSVIPAGALTFSESALYIAESVENDFNTLMESIGINELAVYESTGMTIVYEGEQLKNFKDGAIKFFQDMWAKAKGLFEDLMKKFTTMSKEAKAKMINKIDINKIDDKKKFGKIHEYDISKCNYGEKAAALVDSISNDFEKLANYEELDAELVKSKKEEFGKDIWSKLIGSDVSNSSEAKKKIEESLVTGTVEVDKRYLAAHFAGFRDVVIDNETVKIIKEQYKSTRKYVDKCIKSVKGYTDARTKVASAEISVLKDVGMACNSCIGKSLDIMKRRFNEYRNVLVKAALSSGGDKKDGGKKEPVKEAVSMQMDMIEKAFNF